MPPLTRLQAAVAASNGAAAASTQSKQDDTLIPVETNETRKHVRVARSVEQASNKYKPASCKEPKIKLASCKVKNGRSSPNRLTKKQMTATGTQVEATSSSKSDSTATESTRRHRDESSPQDTNLMAVANPQTPVQNGLGFEISKSSTVEEACFSEELLRHTTLQEHISEADLPDFIDDENVSSRQIDWVPTPLPWPDSDDDNSNRRPHLDSDPSDQPHTTSCLAEQPHPEPDLEHGILHDRKQQVITDSRGSSESTATKHWSPAPTPTAWEVDD